MFKTESGTKSIDSIANLNNLYCCRKEVYFASDYCNIDCLHHQGSRSEGDC